MKTVVSTAKSIKKIRVLITGGATCEDLDTVRFITNRSTGKMGIALAAAAAKKKYSVILLLGENAAAPCHPQFRIERFRSAADLLKKVERHFAWCDWLIMSAAVADFTPEKALPRKYRKTGATDEQWIIRLRRTTDILQRLSQSPLRREKLAAGFSLTDDLNIGEGKRKLRRKKLDLLIANSVSALGKNQTAAALLTKDSPPQIFTSLTKTQLSIAVLAALKKIPLGNYRR